MCILLDVAATTRDRNLSLCYGTDVLDGKTETSWMTSKICSMLECKWLGSAGGGKVGGGFQ